MTPTINEGQEGESLSFEPIYADEFTGTGTLASVSSNWKPLDMSEGLHRAGNQDIDRNGNSDPGNSVDGKRWSAWYDAHQDTVTRVENNQLVMGGLFTNESDPTRVEYTQNGQSVQFNNHKMYTQFLSTWDRVFDNGSQSHITDPNGPDITFEPETFFELSVSFEEMLTQGFRLSWYLLPAYDNAGNSYDADPANGVEVDIFEYERAPGFENHLQMKVIAGEGGGNTPNGSVDLSGFGISTGYHTIGYMWRSNVLIWYVDGIEVQRDTVRIPQVTHYMVLSREMNSGAKLSPSAGELQAVPPYIPQDVGLFAKNIWFDRHKINTDVGRIDYVRAWRITETPQIYGRIIAPPAVVIPDA